MCLNIISRYIHIYIYTYLQIQVYIYVHTYVHAYSYVCIYIYMNIYIYMHMKNQTLWHLGTLVCSSRLEDVHPLLRSSGLHRSPSLRSCQVRDIWTPEVWDLGPKTWLTLGYLSQRPFGALFNSLGLFLLSTFGVQVYLQPWCYHLYGLRSLTSEYTANHGKAYLEVRTSGSSGKEPEHDFWHPPSFGP